MLNFSNLALRRSMTLLFEAVDIKIYAGQKVGITGANGCGKSSLFALIRGQLSADQGEFAMPRHWAVAAVEQETSLSERIALDYVIDGDEELRQVEARLAAAESESEPMAIAGCHERLQEIEGYQAESRAARLLAGLGFDEADIRKPLNSFSGGWIMRLNLARALMCRSDLLLLDEPTNHLDRDSVSVVVKGIRQAAPDAAILLVSHRDEVLHDVDLLLELRDGRIVSSTAS